jgi:flagellar hook-associated protein 1
MSTLFGSLSTALQSLLAQQAALDVTANNISNANTPGYSRQRPVMEESPPVFMGGVCMGTGVTMSQVKSVRDEVLNLRIDQETQQQSQLEAFVDSMQQVEAPLNETQGVGLQSALANFFNSFQALSVNPSDPTLRQSVLAASQSLASTFNQLSSQLQTIQTGLDQSVAQAVGDINRLTAQIAKLNGQISSFQSTGQEANPLEDQRDQAINQLSQLVDVSVVDARDGSLTISTSSGTALVSGHQSFALQSAVSTTTGRQMVKAQGSDITASVESGKIAGLIQVRDQVIPSVQKGLDQLAAGLAEAVNTANKQGTDLNGAQGQDFFALPGMATDGSNSGAAGAIQVVLTDPAKIAAGSDGSSGSNGNIVNFTGIQNAAIIQGQTPEAFYSNLVYGIGDQTSSASADLDAEGMVLTQLQNQQSSVSGVSIDEEAANLIQYQRAFEAAARVVSTVDELTQTLISMVGS